MLLIEIYRWNLTAQGTNVVMTSSHKTTKPEQSNEDTQNTKLHAIPEYYLSLIGHFHIAVLLLRSPLNCSIHYQSNRCPGTPQRLPRRRPILVH